MKDRFRPARALLGQPPPAGIALAFRAFAADARADEFDIGVVLIGRPMAMEIIEEGGPVGQKLTIAAQIIEGSGPDNSRKPAAGP